MQLLAATFGVAFVCGVLWLLGTGGPARLQLLRQPVRYWLFAGAALFGYHALYFLALRLAPPAQANLINYLWPLLIVLLSALSGAERLRAAHLAGAAMGLSGTALLILSRDAGGSGTNPPLGWLAALGCALIWSTYSVFNRRFREVPSEAMVGVCGLVAVLGLIVHGLLDAETVRPRPAQWLAILGLGLGPVGLAFLAWDYGTKHGRLGLLGALSYAAPVLSTMLLVVFGYAPATWSLLVACLLVVGGAWIATRRTVTTDSALQTPVDRPKDRLSG